MTIQDGKTFAQNTGGAAGVFRAQMTVLSSGNSAQCYVHRVQFLNQAGQELLRFFQLVIGHACFDLRYFRPRVGRALLRRQREPELGFCSTLWNVAPGKAHITKLHQRGGIPACCFQVKRKRCENTVTASSAARRAYKYQTPFCLCSKTPLWPTLGRASTARWKIGLTPIRGQLTEGADERFLRGVFSVGLRTGHAISQGMNHALIATDQIFKSSVVALPALLDPILLLACFDHVLCLKR
jgi:hypothetical protein